MFAFSNMSWMGLKYDMLLFLGVEKPKGFPAGDRFLFAYSLLDGVFLALPLACKSSASAKNPPIASVIYRLKFFCIDPPVDLTDYSFLFGSVGCLFCDSF